MKSEHIRYLQEIAILTKLSDRRGMRTSASSIESDKRKQRRVMHDLIEGGYITVHRKTDGEDEVTATYKAYDLLIAQQPDLMGRTFERVDRYQAMPNSNYRVTHHDIAKCIGAPWASLTPQEQKWVVEHPLDYSVCTYNPNWGPETAKLHIIGNADSFKTQSYSAGEALFVSDAAVTAERKKRIEQNKFEFVRDRNLGWGLIELGYLSEGQGEFVQQTDESSFGSRTPPFGINPDKWAEDIDTIRWKLNKRITADTARLHALTQLDIKIQQEGGWASFRKKYDALVRDYLKKKGSDE